MAAPAPRNMAPMHEWACLPPPAAVYTAAATAAPTPAPVPVGEATELPAVEGWALWQSLANRGTSGPAPRAAA